MRTLLRYPEDEGAWRKVIFDLHDHGHFDCAMVEEEDDDLEQMAEEMKAKANILRFLKESRGDTCSG